MNNNFESIPNNQLDNKINVIEDINAIEVSNIYPNDLVKHNLRAEQRKLISYLRNEAYGICRTEISYEYIKASFNRFKQGFVYYKNKEPVAFCIWKVREHLQFSGIYKELYIYLICGKQLDYKLVPRILDDIIHLCRKSDIHYITLEPANDTLKSYYIKCGFKERDTVGGSKVLELDVKTARFKGNPTSKFRFKTQKQIRFKKNNKSHKN